MQVYGPPTAATIRANLAPCTKTACTPLQRTTSGNELFTLIYTRSRESEEIEPNWQTLADKKPGARNSNPRKAATYTGGDKTGGLASLMAHTDLLVWF